MDQLLSDKRNVCCLHRIKCLKTNFLNTFQLMRHSLETKYNIVNNFSWGITSYMRQSRVVRSKYELKEANFVNNSSRLSGIT